MKLPPLGLANLSKVHPVLRQAIELLVYSSQKMMAKRRLLCECNLHTAPILRLLL